jgi:hypothetical protein
MIKQKKYIFFVATPMHLMCIYELHKKYPDRRFELIVYWGENQFANSQLYKSLEILGFDNYHSAQLYGNAILNYLIGLKLIVKFYKRFNASNVIINIVDFQNSFMHSLRHFFKNATFILIDDGFSTYAAYEQYLKNNIYLPIHIYTGIGGTIKRLLYFGKSYQSLQKEKIEVFSFYSDNFNSSKFLHVQNDFSSLKKTLKLKSPPLNNQKVFVIGGKQSERGAMTLKDELFYVEWLNKYWKSKGKDLFYIAKRSSSNSKISLIEKLKIPCLRFDLPLEIALINNEFIPGIVCSTGSTLLKTLPMLYDSIEYYLVDVSSLYIYKADIENFNYFKIFLSSHFQMETLTIKHL